MVYTVIKRYTWGVAITVINPLSTGSFSSMLAVYGWSCVNLSVSSMVTSTVTMTCPLRDGVPSSVAVTCS